MLETDDLTIDEKTEHDQLVDKKERLKLVSSFVKHPCWDGIIWPMLNNEREASLSRLLSEENLSFDVLLNLRAEVRAIDSLVGKINFIITEGKDAAEQLKGKPL